MVSSLEFVPNLKITFCPEVEKKDLLLNRIATENQTNKLCKRAIENGLLSKIKEKLEKQTQEKKVCLTNCTKITVFEKEN